MFGMLGMFDPHETLTSTLTSTFSPYLLFVSGEQGAWYDPSDFRSMFQDSAGTTPVTAIEQPVGRILDKSGNNNHASQSTTTSRPILRNLYNLLQYTEQFNTSAYWQTASNVTVLANQTTAPDGTNTADLMTEAATTATHRVSANNNEVVINGAPSLTISCYYKANTGSPFACLFLADNTGNHQTRAWFNLTTGVKASSQTTGAGVVTSYTMEAAANGFYRCTLTGTVGSASIGTLAYVAMADADLSISYAGSTERSTFIWGASVVSANEATIPYQRVVTNTLGSGVYNTDTTKFKPYLAFDGTDDWLQTGNIDFSATDKMSVFAGIRKLSNAAQNVVVELSASIASNNGAFLLSAPISAAANYSFSSKGTSRVDNTVTTYAAPITNVVTGLATISAPSNIIRVNGIATTVTTSQGTGNYGSAYPLYVGRRGGTTLSFSGRIYSLIVRGALTSSPQLEQTETWVNSKTGAY